MTRKLQYQSIARTIFVPAATIAVFSSFSQPLPSKAAAHRAPSVCNAPIVPTPAAPVFSSFSQPVVKRAAPVDQTSFAVAPPSRPAFVGFAQFSQPVVSRGNLPDEQPSALFEVLPPAGPPVIGFARFSEYVPRTSINVAPSFVQFTFIPTVDTHDGVFVKRKRKPQDPLKLKLEEQNARRAAIELAVYGPPQEEAAPAELPAPFAVLPVDVSALAAVIAQHEQAMMAQRAAQAQAQEDDDIEAIMREIML